MDRDLFMDIHFSAKNFGQLEIAEAAYKKAEELDTGSYVSSSSASSHSSEATMSLYLTLIVKLHSYLLFHFFFFFSN